MKKQLLLKFAAFMVAAILFSAKVNAQIVYTDVNPNDTASCNLSSCSDSINIDIKSNGSTDFIFTFKRTLLGLCGGLPRPRPSRMDYTLSASTISANSFYGIVSSNPSALNFGNSIDSNLIWSNGVDTLWNNTRPSCNTASITSGNWNLTTDLYLPFKIADTGGTYFGWIRMERTSSLVLILKDYAYNSIPNQPILAGQTVATGIVENNFSSTINLYPNPAKGHFTIELESTSQQVDVTIMDLSGKAIYTSTTAEAKKLENNTTEFAEGIYMVKIQSGEFVATKKLVIAR